jgi:hypothetical protein
MTPVIVTYCSPVASGRGLTPVTSNVPLTASGPGPRRMNRGASNTAYVAISSNSTPISQPTWPW